MENESPHYRIARDDFRRARRLAALKQINARLRGKPTDLLPFEEVRKILKASGEEPHGLQTIPLDAIVGSVGRYTDFTRDFLPRRDALAGRWVRLRASIREKGLLKPIQVYQIGEVYFVLDGNHRVSVARERGAREIQAYVTEIPSKINITPETDLDELILKSETANFLDRTNLNNTCPKVDLTVTAPGQYQGIENQIEYLRKEQETKRGQPITFEEAAQLWCQEVYIPVAKTIRKRGILRDFPNRTETDLYVWILRHQERLQQELGWRLEPTVIATDIADQHSSRPDHLFARLANQIQSTLVPEPLKRGPRPGTFRTRQEKIHAHDPAHLFTHMLVPLSGEGESWQALEFGLRLAWREEAHLLGLHIVPRKEDRDSPKVAKIREHFELACQDAGLPGELAVEVGEIVPTICKRARLSDLIIIHLAQPPEEHPVMRVGGGLSRLIQQSPRPILNIPRVPEKFERILVAYNGNPRSREALYAAAYFASRWEVPLFVLTVAEPGTIKPKIIHQARYYLHSRRIPATFIQRDGPIAEVILDTQAEQHCNFIFMGGYSKPPVIDKMLGSPLDQVLRETPVPVLVCR